MRQVLTKKSDARSRLRCGFRVKSPRGTPQACFSILELLVGTTKQAGTGTSRLKNSQKTSMCQVFSFTVLENRNVSEKNNRVAQRGSLARVPGALKSHNAEKLKGGPFEVFQHPLCCKTSKNAGGPFGEKNFNKKVWQCQKNERGDPLVSPGMVCYAEKQEKLFWFSSLGQIVQFGAIILVELLRTILVSSCGWKKRVTMIVAFHFMKRRLKIGTREISAVRRKTPSLIWLFLARFGMVGTTHSFKYYSYSYTCYGSRNAQRTKSQLLGGPASTLL